MKPVSERLQNSLFHANLRLFRIFLLCFLDIVLHVLQVLLYLRHIFSCLANDRLKMRFLDLLMLPVLIHVTISHVFQLLITGFDRCEKALCFQHVTHKVDNQFSVIVLLIVFVLHRFNVLHVDTMLGGDFSKCVQTV